MEEDALRPAGAAPVTDDDRALYFLLAKTLEASPFASAAAALKEALSNSELGLQRYDYKGGVHSQTFNQASTSHSHVTNDTLPAILEHFKHPSLEPTQPTQHRELLGHGHSGPLPKPPAVAASHRLLAPRNNSIQSLHGFERRLRTIGNQSVRCMDPKRLYKQFNRLQLVIGHTAPCYCILPDRTGQRIITGSDDNNIKIWGTRTMLLLATLRGHEKEISDLTLSGDNNILASGDMGGTIYLWDHYSGEVLQKIVHHNSTQPICGLAFSSDPALTILVSASKDSTLGFWEYTVKEGCFSIQPHPQLAVVDTRTPPADEAPPMMHYTCPCRGVCKCAVEYMTVSKGGNLVGLALTNGAVQIWQLLQEQPVLAHQDTLHSASVEFVTFNHEGTALVSGGRDTQAFLRQLQHGWQGQRLEPLYQEPMKKMYLTWGCWTGDDLRIVSSLENKALDQDGVFLVVWDAVSCRRLHKIKAHQFSMTSLLPHPLHARMVFSSAMDGRVLLWDVWSGQLVRECTVQHAAAGDETYFVDVLAAAVSGGGERMYTVDTWGGLTVFGLGTTCQKVPGSQFLDIEASNIISDATGNLLHANTNTLLHLVPTRTCDKYMNPLILPNDGYTLQQRLERSVVTEQTLLQTRLRLQRQAQLERERLAAVAKHGLRPAPNAVRVVPTTPKASKARQRNNRAGARQLSAEDLQLDRDGVELLDLTAEFGFDDDDEEYQQDHRLGDGQDDDEEEEQDDDDDNDDGDESLSDWDAVQATRARRTRQQNRKTAKARNHRSQHRYRFRNNNDGDDDDDDEEEDLPSSPVHRAKPGSPRARKRVQADLTWEDYLPSEWISKTSGDASPYLPQVKDVVVWFQQGHSEYLRKADRTGWFNSGATRPPWDRHKLRAHEECSIDELVFESYPPAVAVAKARIINPLPDERGTISFRYCDLPGVPDFLILKSRFEAAMSVQWQAGHRFRSIIDDDYWYGTVMEKTPVDTAFPDSPWRCFKVRWDMSAQGKMWDDDRMSSWEMEVLPAYIPPKLSVFLNPATDVSETAMEVGEDVEQAPAAMDEDTEQQEETAPPASTTDADAADVTPQVPSALHNTPQPALTEATSSVQKPSAVVAANTIVHDTRQPPLPLLLQEPPTVLPVDAAIVARDTLDPAESERLLKVVTTLRERPLGFYHRFPVPYTLYKTYCQSVTYPVDLQMIQERLENGLYRRQEAIQWDLDLMNANTHTFNQKKSDIATFSTMLHQVLSAAIHDATIVDIEASFPEVLAPTDNQQLLTEISDILANRHVDTIAELSPMKVPRQRNAARQAEVSRPSRSTRAQARPNYSDALNEEEDEDFQEEAAQAAASGPALAEERERRAALRAVKRTMLTDPDTVDHNYIVLCGELHTSLLTHSAAQYFLEPVDLALYPDYLEHVALPSCFRDVQERLSSGDYETAEDYVKAVQLVLENAYFYNINTPGLIKAVEEMEDVFNNRQQELFQTVLYKGGGELIGRQLRDDLLQGVLDPLMAEDAAQQFIPALDTTADWYSDYCNQIAKPMWLERVRAKLASRSYKKLRMFVNECVVVFANAMRFNEPDSKLYIDAERLLDQFIALLSATTDYKPPNTFVDPILLQLKTLDQEQPFPKAHALSFVDMLIALDENQWFCEIDPNLEGYSDVITSPMDLSTVRAQLDKGQCNTLLDYYKKVRLVFLNARMYNAVGSPGYDAACSLHEQFQTEFKQLLASMATGNHELIANRRLRSKQRSSQHEPEAQNRRSSRKRTSTAARVAGSDDETEDEQDDVYVARPSRSRASKEVGDMVSKRAHVEENEDEGSPARRTRRASRR